VNLLFRRPAVWIDAVQYVSGVMINGTEGPYDAEALVPSGLDAERTLVEGAVDQQPAGLYTYTHARNIDLSYLRGPIIDFKQEETRTKLTIEFNQELGIKGELIYNVDDEFSR